MKCLLDYSLFLLAFYFFGSLIVQPVDMEIYLPIASIFHLMISILPFKMTTTCQKLKTLLLTIRSLLCAWNFIYEIPVYHNYVTCIIVMGINDIICLFCKDDIIPHRDMMEHFQFMDDVMQYFMIENEYTSYIPIFTIQISPLLTHMLNKKYINEGYWNVLYHGLINSNIWAIVKTDYLFGPVCYCSCSYIHYMHHTYKENKYICWMIVFISHSIIKQWVRTFRYIPDDFLYYPWIYYLSFYVYQYLSYYSVWNRLT